MYCKVFRMCRTWINPFVPAANGGTRVRSVEQLLVLCCGWRQEAVFHTTRFTGLFFSQLPPSRHMISCLFFGSCISVFLFSPRICRMTGCEASLWYLLHLALNTGSLDGWDEGEIKKETNQVLCPWWQYQHSTSCPPDQKGSCCRSTYALAWSIEVTWLIFILCVCSQLKKRKLTNRTIYQKLSEFLKLWETCQQNSSSVSASASGWSCVRASVRHKHGPVWCCSDSLKLKPSRGLFVWIQSVVSCHFRPEEGLLLHKHTHTHTSWSHTRTALYPELVFVSAEQIWFWLSTDRILSHLDQYSRRKHALTSMWELSAASHSLQWMELAQGAPRDHLLACDPCDTWASSSRTWRPGGVFESYKSDGVQAVQLASTLICHLIPEDHGDLSGNREELGPCVSSYLWSFL